MAMELLLPCPLPCNCDSHCNTNDSSTPSQHYHHLHSDSSSSSLSSQSSLPSVPSLSRPPPQQPPEEDKNHNHPHHQCIATLSGHSSYVSSLALSPGSLLSASSDGEVRTWPFDTPFSATPHDSFPAATSCSAVKCVATRGDTLFTAHQDHKIRLWKLLDHKSSKDYCINSRRSDDRFRQKRYKLVASLPTWTDRVSKLLAKDNYVEVRRHRKSTWVHHVDAVSSLALTPDGSLLYSASWDRSLKTWRTSDLRCLDSVKRAHDDAINAVVFSLDGFVYTASADKKIKVWRRETQQSSHGYRSGALRPKHALVETLDRHRSAVKALALTADGRVMYSGACDRSILVWEKVEGKDGGGGSSDSGGGGEGEYMVLVGALRGHKKAILCLAAVGDDLVCSGSADNTVRIWRRMMGRDEKSWSYSCLVVCEGHDKPVKCLAASVEEGEKEDGLSSCSRRGYLVYSGGLDCKIRVWRVWAPSSSLV